MDDKYIINEEVKYHIGGMPLPMPGNVLNLILINSPDDTLYDFEITLLLNNDHLAAINKLYTKCSTEHDKIYALNSYLTDLKYMHEVPECTDLWEEVEFKFDDEEE